MLSSTKPAVTPETAEEPRDLGFGSVVADESRLRLLNRDGSFNVSRRGLRTFETLAPYHALLTMGWLKFLGLVTLFYIGANALFALAYFSLGTGGLFVTHPAGTEPLPRLWDAFFFSIQTFATIGYGQIAPEGLAANLIVTVESLVGIMTQALAAGLLFARFARPSANILFSNNALISPYRDGSAFMFRITNHRTNELIEMRARVLFSYMAERDGKRVRTFEGLTLEREHVVFFPLAWTVVHPIDEQSPLFGTSHEDLMAMEAEFLILLTGTDETFSASVHTRSSYRAEEIVWNARFTDMFRRNDRSGRLAIEISHIHDYAMLTAERPARSPDAGMLVS